MFRVPGLLRLLACTVLFVFATGLPAPATGNESDSPSPDDLSASEREKFAQLLHEGKDAYQSENYEEAIPRFEKAYEMLPVPGLLYRMAQAYERSDSPAEAFEYYRRYLETDPEGERRQRAEKLVDELRDEIRSSIRISTTPAKARLHVGTGEDDETFRGVTPETVEVAPGEVQVTVRKKGYEPRSETLEVESQRHETYELQLTESSRNTLPVAATVAGAVGAVSYGVLYGIGRNCQNNPQDCAPGFYRPVATSSYGAAALAVAGTGVATYLWLSRSASSSRDRQSARTLVRPRLVVTPFGLGISGQF